MFITCPSCSTQFRVSDSALGHQARRVRCFHCGEVWTEHPAGDVMARRAPPTRRLAATARVASTLMEAAAVTRAVQARPAPAPRPIAPPKPRTAAKPMAAEPARAAARPQPAPPPMPEPTPEPDEELDPDLVLGGADDDFDRVEPMAPQPEPQPGHTMSDEELDAMLGPEHEFEPMQSLVEHPKERADDDADEMDVADVKPFPEVFTAADIRARERKPSGGGLKIAAIALLTLLLVAAAGLFFGRTLIAEMWPPAAEYYKMIGLSAHTLGSGLAIRDVRSERSNEAGGDALIVSGTIENVNAAINTVPNIRVALFDAANDMVQSLVMAPTSAEVQPNGEQTFRAVIPNPSPIARRLEVTFTEDPVN
jgi:predicted Zn finger-like uncharacterized protein